SAGASYRRLLIHEYGGIAVTGLDVVAKNIANGSTTSDAVTSTSATTTASGELVFGAVMDDAGLNNIAAGTGFTLRQSVNNKDLASEDLVQSSSGSVAATFTFSAADRYLAQMVSFKAAASGNTPPTVATPAAATPNPVTGTTTNLSVLGADNGGEADLIYTWATTGTDRKGVTFSANRTEERRVAKE